MNNKNTDTDIDHLIDYKKDFAWFKNNQDTVYFDNAATTLKPQCVIDAINNFYTKYDGMLDNNNEQINQEITKQIDETKINLTQLIQADINEIFFSTGATHSLNIIADILEDVLHKDDEIVLPYIDHGANLLPWFKLRDRIGIKLVFIGKENARINKDDVINAITKKTKVVTFSNASNLLANKVDTKQIINAIKKIDPKIYCVVDATQFIEHYKVNCHNFNCDFLVGSAHKILGPTGIGFLYIKNTLLHKKNQEIYFVNGNNQFKQYLKLTDYIPPFFDYSSIFGFNAALKYWLNIGYEAMHQREYLLKKYFLEHFDFRKDVVLYTPELDSPFITLNFLNPQNNKTINGQDIEYFLAQRSVLSRSTLSCAKLARYPLKTDSVVRLSMLFYNDKKDLDHLLKILKNYKFGDELDGLL